jgi:hypothetical protein
LLAINGMVDSIFPRGLEEDGTPLVVVEDDGARALDEERLPSS